MDDILAILQVCNKDDKSADQQKYSHLNEIMGLEKAKWKLMLNGVVIAASGKDLILFACDNAASASRINSDKENRGLYGFLRDDLHIEKRPYAITSRQFQDAARQFMIRRKNNTQRKLDHSRDRRSKSCTGSLHFRRSEKTKYKYRI